MAASSIAVVSACVTCELVERRDRGEAPPWDRIHRTERRDVAHAFGTRIEGWLVLVLRRHATSLADLTDDEATELGQLVKRVSGALQTVLRCPKTYVAQFAEAPGHPHVHVHVIARHLDQPAAWTGPAIFFHGLGVDPTDEVPEERRNEIASALAASI